MKADSHPSPPLSAGLRVGEYVLDVRLGRGTFGEVWRARHHAWSDQYAAVKVPSDPHYVRLLQREGATVAQLTHVNVVRPIAFDPWATVPYLISEYVPGRTLRERLREGRVALVPAANVLRQILAALTYAHGRGVVHRDVKPENVLLHESGEASDFAAPGSVKLTDFGLGGKAGSDVTSGGRADGEDRSIAFSLPIGPGTSANPVGTIDYLAPEARNGTVHADPRHDLYACGVVWHEMLTGEKPAGTDGPRDLVPSLPKWADDLFRRAYARADKRFASAEAFLAALNGGTEGGSPEPPARLRGSDDREIAARVATPRRATACAFCSHAVAEGDQFCMHCGRQLTGHVVRCRRCGGYPGPEDAYCVFCGEAIRHVPTYA